MKSTQIAYNNDTEERFHWNHFQLYFLQLMNNKNIDSQSESTSSI